MNSDVFLRSCVEKFRFLRDEFGFIQQSGQCSSSLCEVSYWSLPIAVNIDYDLRDQYIDVLLHRLVDGKQADDFYDWQRNRFNLQAILDIRNPNIHPFPQGITGRILPADEVDEILAKYAISLRTFASDILRGDLTILPEVEELIRSRA